MSIRTTLIYGQNERVTLERKLMELCYIKMWISSSDGSVSESVRLLYAVWYSTIIYSSGSQSGLYRPPVGRWDYLGGGSWTGDWPLRTRRFFTIEVALDQTLGNWYHFMKPIHRINNLLIVR
jgi:hypothetical protein